MRRGTFLGLVFVAILGLLMASGCQSAAPEPTEAPAKKAEAPKAEAPKAEAPKAEAPKAEAPKAEAPKPAPPKAEAPKAEAPKAEKPEVANLKVGTVPIASVAMALAADKLGYFKDEGLTVELTSLAGGAAALPALTAGKLDFAYSSFPSVPLGRAEGFDYIIVIGGNSTLKAPPDAAPLNVLQDGPVKSVKDLEGKRIGINTLNNINWLYVREILERGGVDLKKITFTEIPFPQMADTLFNKQLDAVNSTEPFTTLMKESGKARAVAYPFVDVEPGLNIAHWVSSEKWVKANPITTRKFTRAIGRAIEYMNSHEDDKLKYMAEFTKGDINLLKKTTLDLLVAKADVKSLQGTIDLMVKHGLLKQKMDASTMLWETAK